MVPLIHKAQVIGTVSMRSRKVEAFGPRGQAILERLANLIAPAVQNAELYEQRLRTENQLRVAKENYRNLFENAAVSIYQAITGGRFLSVNRAFDQMCGSESPEDLMANVTDRETVYRRS